MSTMAYQGYRLSPLQERCWDLLQSAPSTPIFDKYAFLVEGELNNGALKKAFERVINRHEILRASFKLWPGMTVPVQVINQEGFNYQFHNWDGVDSDEQDARLRAMYQSDLGYRLDSENQPPLSVALCRLSPHTHALVLSLPSMCSDPTSADNILREVSRYYDDPGRAEEETAAIIQYPDYSQWHSELLESDEAGAFDPWWREQSLASRHLVKFPYEGDELDSSPFKPEVIFGEIGADRRWALESLHREYDLPASTTLLACWLVLLWRVSGQSELTIGVGRSGRRYPELESSIGLFERNIPFHCALTDSLQWVELARKIDDQIEDTDRRQEYFSWDRVLKQGDERASYFGITYSYLEDNQPRTVGGLSLSLAYEYACSERRKVGLSIRRYDDVFRIAFYYDSNLLTENYLRRLESQFYEIVDNAARNPRAMISELGIVGSSERESLLHEFNRPAPAELPGDFVLSRFERQAEAFPDRIAVVRGGDGLTYRELNERANQLAHLLIARGVGPESRVGVCVEPSFEMLVALFGIFKAGAAYAPLDPMYPGERLRYMVADSQAFILLTQSSLLHLLPKYEGHIISLDEGGWREGRRRDNPGVDTDGAHLAYVIYTSGSTGKPKGVAVSQDNLALSTAARDHYYQSSGIRFLLLSSFAFDSSVAGIFWTLANGERLYLSEEIQRRDPEDLARIIAESQITHILCLPTLYQHVLRQGRPSLSSVEAVIVAGESCPGGLVEAHGKSLPGAPLYNEYGPTEATVWASVFDCRAYRGEHSTPIGRPIATAQLYVLDSRLNLSPQGSPGELCVSGAGLARGYLNSPDLTAEKFVPHPFSGHPGGRLYRTGDLAAHLPDGNLKYSGRIDNQVKIRGYRVEPEEIESVLTQHPAIKQAVVLVQSAESGDARLCGFVVPESGAPAESSEFALHRFDDGLEVAHFNREETESIYKEIFQEQIYLRHGITLADGDCVFDVGANIGLFTLFAHQTCADLKVFAFEPIPQIFDRLKSNVTRYGLEAELFNCGLSDKKGESKYLFYPNWTGMSGAYADASADAEVTKAYLRNQPESLREYGEAALNGRFDAEPHWRPTTTLSAVLREKNVPRIDLLKIDVEKSEWDVLQGIEDADWGKVRQVVLEVHQLDDRLARVTALLEGKGFRVSVDQEPEFVGTGLYHVYALRPGRVASRGQARKLCGAGVNRAISLPEIQRYLTDRLPAHMIPSRLTRIDNIPLTPNGKIDRQALLELPPEEPQQAEGFDAPRSLVEELLAGIWSRVMGRERVGRRDDFFELGGHSILATQITAKIREVFRVEMSIRSLFRFPVLAQLSAHIETLIQESRLGDRIQPIQRVPRGGRLPLSHGQRRLWFLQRLEPESVAYNLPLAVSLKGPLNIRALEFALSEILRRHEVLRTCFPEVDGDPIQEILPATDLSVPVIDLIHLPEPTRDRKIRELALEEARLPFDLSRSLALRAKLIRRDEREHIALLTMHHIASDGWSLAVFVREVADLYTALSEGGPARRPEPPIQYADYAHWQRQWVAGGALERGLAFWKLQLSNLSIGRLPSDFPYDPDRPLRCGKLTFALSKEPLEELSRLALQADATLFMVLLTVFLILLRHVTKETDVSAGTPFANRDRPEISHSIGYFANTLVMRAKVSEDSSFGELLEQVRQTALEAYAHQDVPLDQIVKAIHPEGDFLRRSLFQSTFSFQNITVPSLELAGVTAAPLELGQDIAMFDLMLDLWMTPEGLAGMFRYNAALFLPATIELWSKMYQLILEKALAQREVKIDQLRSELSDLERRHNEDKKHLLDGIRDKKLASTLHKRSRERVAVSDERLVEAGPLYPDRHFPLLVQPGLEGVCLKTWLSDHRDLVEEWLSQSGAILFRGFALNSDEEFESVISCVSPEMLEYRERSSPRSQVRGNIYTSTNHPASQGIFFHNENSYQISWPMKIAFFCASPALEGGYTPISDCRKVYERIKPEIRNRFRDKQVMYVRNFSEEIGLSWQTAFQTSDKSVVERYCRQSGIEAEWVDGGRLRTRQIRPAIIQHPRTKEPIWFNHAAFFHVSTLEPVTREVILNGYSEESLPNNSYYGDGSQIEDGVLEEIRDAYRQESVTFPWRRHDLMLLDNVKIAHGRTSYEGERVILVAMMDPHPRPSNGN
jgi:amino acid adenylation domain-containing protein/FkbM family methyltransferase